MVDLDHLPLLRNFLRNEDGAGTAYSLLTLAAMAMLGGYAIDVSNVMTARTNLQVTADAAAHAALLKRDTANAEDAKLAALAMAEKNLPSQDHGVTLTTSDIVFGDWNEVTRTFTPRASSRSAVQVTARQTSANTNPVPVFLLQFVGMDSWDVINKATYVTYHPTCLREGFVAEDVVDIQSNNSFHDGFCVHSNNYVSLNSNNYFEPGTVVSMPDLDDLELPNSGYKTNTGLSEALREGGWNIRVVDRIQDIINGIASYDPRYVPDYITSQVPVPLAGTTVTQAMLLPGRIHTYTCNGNKRMTIDNNVLMSKVVLVTNCEIKFSQGVAMEDAIIATTNTSADSLNAPSGLRVGKKDNCAEGGGAQLLTMGSVKVASALEMYNGQILAKNDIEFAANADGIQGAAMVAGGTISGTSNMSMGYCGSGMEDNFHAEYFKLVE
ncbi:MAG: TadG family pilus assembly protein [Paracoccaceae bacterium]